jgi:plastocyanin
MRSGILLALVGTSLIALAMISMQLVYAGGGGGKSYVTQECGTMLCQIEMVNLTFTPDTLKARPLADIVWTNNDSVRHMVTSGSYGSIEAPLASTFIDPGESYKFSFQQPGKYQYFCQIHPLMRGVIVVDSSVIPEFPSIALLIVAGTLAPIIVMTRLRKTAFKIDT